MIHLDLGGCSKITDVGLRRWARGCRNVFKLGLPSPKAPANSKITDQGLESVAKYCQKLVRLDLGFHVYEGDALARIGPGCTIMAEELKHVNLRVVAQVPLPLLFPLPVRTPTFYFPDRPSFWLIYFARAKSKRTRWLWPFWPFGVTVQ